MTANTPVTLEQLQADLLHAYRETFPGDQPTLCAFAPGRVNLIGEHVDYNDGFVFPMAIPLGTMIIGKALDAASNNNQCYIRTLSSRCDRLERGGVADRILFRSLCVNRRRRRTENLRIRSEQRNRTRGHAQMGQLRSRRSRALPRTYETGHEKALPSVHFHLGAYRRRTQFVRIRRSGDVYIPRAALPRRVQTLESRQSLAVLQSRADLCPRSVRHHGSVRLVHGSSRSRPPDRLSRQHVHIDSHDRQGGVCSRDELERQARTRRWSLCRTCPTLPRSCSTPR